MGVVFLNGDRYVGEMKDGRKQGSGMYVYADMVTYRGDWEEDVLDGVRHPVTEEALPIEVKLLNAEKVEVRPTFRDDDKVNLRCLRNSRNLATSSVAPARVGS